MHAPAIPHTLILLLLNALLVLGQTTLPLDEPVQLSTGSLPHAPTFLIPASPDSPLTVSVALCSLPAADGPRFFVTNDPSIRAPGPDGGPSVVEVMIQPNGVGSVTFAEMQNGGVVRVLQGTGEQVFELALSETGEPHELLPELPLLGDTSSNQALLFSPPFLPLDSTSPTYPNYTLPPANPTPPPEPVVTPNYTLIVGPTSSFPVFNPSTNTTANGLPVTACALRNATNIAGLILDPSVADGRSVVRGEEWRTQWLVQGLQAHTNYTVYVVQNGTKLAGPINVVTKSASFSCPLVHSLPYCSKVSYAAPLPAPPFPFTAHDATTLPNTLTDPLLSYMTNFTTTLLTFACGRDWYSPVQSCEQCQAAYRDWLCAVSFPRCGETPLTSSRPRGPQSATAQVVFPALADQPTTSPPRNPNLAGFETDYEVLLPCLETCNAVDRACPNFLGFACPLPSFNANESYGVGFIDGDRESGVWEQGGGVTGMAQDRWGNVWCGS